MNGPSFNPVPALVAKLLTVWVRTSERGGTSVLEDRPRTYGTPFVTKIKGAHQSTSRLNTNVCQHITSTSQCNVALRSLTSTSQCNVA